MNTYQVQYSYTDTESGKRKKSNILVVAEDTIDCSVTALQIEDLEMVITNIKDLGNVIYVDRLEEHKVENEMENFFWQSTVEIPTEDTAPLKETMFIYANTQDHANEYAHGIMRKNSIFTNYQIISTKRTNLECALKSLSVNKEKTLFQDAEV